MDQSYKDNNLKPSIPIYIKYIQYLLLLLSNSHNFVHILIDGTMVHV